MWFVYYNIKLNEENEININNDIDENQNEVNSDSNENENIEDICENNQKKNYKKIFLFQMEIL